MSTLAIPKLKVGTQCAKRYTYQTQPILNIDSLNEKISTTHQMGFGTIKQYFWDDCIKADHAKYPRE